MTLILDGDNVLRALRLVRGVATTAAENFLQQLELLAADRGWEVTVVFDGPERFLRREAGLLVVRYAPRGTTADTLIERLVYQAADRTRVVVVTRDRVEADLVLGLGAQVWTPQRLREEMETRE